MTSLRYRVWHAIATGQANTTAALAELLAVPKCRADDAVHGLVSAGAIQRHPGSYSRKTGRYEAVPGAKVPQEGRGNAPGSAQGRRHGPLVSTERRTGKKRSPLPKAADMHPLDRLWPAVVKIAAWR